MDGEIDPDDLYDLIEADANVRIVDIRSPSAFACGHVPGSENIPFGSLPGEVDALSGADRIVTVCPHGKASVQAARLITSYEGTTGATVESLAGGLEAWDYDLDVEDGGGDGSAAPF